MKPHRYCYVFRSKDERAADDPTEEVAYKDEPVEDPGVTQYIQQMREIGLELQGYFALTPVEGFESLGSYPSECMS